MNIDDLLSATPATELTKASYTYLTEIAAPYVVNHSLRSYYFSRVVAENRGLTPSQDYDDELVFLSCALHDLGLTEQGNGNQRFEVDGADLAVKFLEGYGLDAARAEVVWDAIALHTSPGIADRKRHEIALAHQGISVDIFGFGREMVPDGLGQSLYAAYPRLELGRQLGDTVAAQASANPRKAPPFTFPAGVLAERLGGAPGPTYAELLAACPW
ncbi:HD domain-containing protein [Streptomyces chartreusis]